MLITDSGTVEKTVRIIIFSIIAFYTLDQIELGLPNLWFRWLGIADEFPKPVFFSGAFVALFWIGVLFLLPGLIVLVALVGLNWLAEKQPDKHCQPVLAKSKIKE